MTKTAKKPTPAVEKKLKVKKVIEKPKPVHKSVAKKVVKAEKKPSPGGISGKYTGVKEKKPQPESVKKDVPKTDKPGKPKVHKKSRASSSTRAVVKINSLPHGFYEEQLKGYFSQFGDVTNVKVARSLKTGRSKGVAFVEFSVPEVAEIAAETMNNYLLMKNLLKTEYIPPNKVKPGLFNKTVEVVIKPDGSQFVQSAVIESRKKEVRRLNVKPTEAQAKKRQQRLENKLRLKNKFLKKLGVDLNVANLVEGQLNLVTPVKKPSDQKKKVNKNQKITVKVSNDPPKAGTAEKEKPAANAKKQKTEVVAAQKDENVTKEEQPSKSATRKAKLQETKSTKEVKKAVATKPVNKVQIAQNKKKATEEKKPAALKAKKEIPVKEKKTQTKAAPKIAPKVSPKMKAAEKKPIAAKKAAGAAVPTKSLEKKKAAKLSPKKKSVK